MNRYIITLETIRGQKYIISALYDENKKMIEVTPDTTKETSIIGNIYIGRVENVVQNLNAAFIKISPTQNCYLSLDDCKNAVFTKKISEKKTLAAGEELLVQISREALKTKDAAVTTNLSFAGKYAVLTSGNKKHSVSSKLPKDVRRHYQEILKNRKASYDACVEGCGHLSQDMTCPGKPQQQRRAAERMDESIVETGVSAEYGIIIRTNAAGVSDETVLAELNALENQYRKLITTAPHKTSYSLLYQEEPPYLRHLNDLKEDSLEAVVTDDREIFEQICEKYGIAREKLMTTGSVSVPINDITLKNGLRIQYYQDEILSLSALYSVKSSIEDVLKTRVWLKSGAYLVIEPTEALTVIDVNTGKNIAKKDVQENFLKVNKEAAVEIARQLRLRNISGIVVVDFINLESKEAQEDLLRTFRAALKQDPIPTQLVDMTGLGLIEVTRKKIKKPLSEIFAAGRS